MYIHVQYLLQATHTGKKHKEQTQTACTYAQISHTEKT